jgi:hypothetical protein
MTPDFIERHHNQMWNWGRYGLSSNPSISIELIDKFPTQKWYYGSDGLSSNPMITPEILKQIFDNTDSMKTDTLKQWNWGSGGLSSNPSMTPEFVLETIFDDTKQWNFHSCNGIFNNQGMTLDFYETILTNEEYVDRLQLHPENEYTIQRYLDILSRNPLLTEEFIENHPEYLPYWNTVYLTSNPSISHEFYTEYYLKELGRIRPDIYSSSLSGSGENSYLETLKLKSLYHKSPNEYLEWIDELLHTMNTMNVSPRKNMELFTCHIQEYNRLEAGSYADAIAKSTSYPFKSFISQYPYLNADFVIKNMLENEIHSKETMIFWDFGELGLSSNTFTYSNSNSKTNLSLNPKSIHLEKTSKQALLYWI